MDHIYRYSISIIDRNPVSISGHPKQYKFRGGGRCPHQEHSSDTTMKVKKENVRHRTRSTALGHTRKSRVEKTTKLKPVMKWPCFGGGALGLRLHQHTKSGGSQMFLGDISMALVTTYEVIRDDVEDLILLLGSPEYLWTLDLEMRADAYGSIRDSYNELLRLGTLGREQRIQLAAAFLYLNKTNYNGLYRVNKEGKYNVSVDKATKGRKTIFDPEALQSMSTFLNRKGVTLFQGSYKILVKNAKAGDFIYFDPPYDGGFTQYDKAGFSWDDQVKLKRTVDVLDRRGCYVMISNRATERIKALYKNYHQDFVNTKYHINCKAEGRKQKAGEIIIRNWIVCAHYLKQFMGHSE